MMFKIIGVVVFSLLFDVQVVVSSKERKVFSETVQDVEAVKQAGIYERRGSDAQEEPVVEPDARWNQAVNGLL